MASPPVLSPPPLSTAITQQGGPPSLPWSRWLQALANVVGQVRLAKDGPSVAQGAGVPTIDLPNGSLFLRTDGTGPNLYVRENGAWVPK
jgi:hypothetical protein